MATRNSHEKVQQNVSTVQIPDTMATTVSTETYMDKVTYLAHSYPSLRILNDFSGAFRSSLLVHNKLMDVTILEQINGRQTTHQASNKEGLAKILQSGDTSPTLPAQGQGADNLICVISKDVSVNVYELLGSRFGIDPSFFQQHVFDDSAAKSLHMTRHTASVPNIAAKRRNWFRLRHVRLRSHNSLDQLRDAEREVAGWKVTRALASEDRTRSTRAKDGPPYVSLVNTQTSFWLGEDDRRKDTSIAIILADPTINAGDSVWGGAGNWLPIPAINGPWPPKMYLHSEDLYKDIVELSVAFAEPVTANSSSSSRHQTAILPGVYTISAEWFLVCEYVKLRLAQIERALHSKTQLGALKFTVERGIAELEPWRENIPVYREMIREAIEVSLPTIKRLMYPEDSGEDQESLNDISCDFKRISELLDEQQDRVRYLADRLNAEMQLEAARQSVKAAHQSLVESKNIARLTWLATIFIPLTFVTGLFSMSDDLAAMTKTFKIYFMTALPVALGSLIVARWGSVVVRAFWEALKRGFWSLLDKIRDKPDSDTSAFELGPTSTNRPSKPTLGFGATFRQIEARLRRK